MQKMRSMNNARRTHGHRHGSGTMPALMATGLVLACCGWAARAGTCDGRGIDPCAHVAAGLLLYDTPAASTLIAPPEAAAAPAQRSALAPAAAVRVALTPAQRRVVALAPSIRAVGRAYAIDPLLLHAMADVESRHDPQARSRAGALGVLQVRPDTARRFGIAGAETALLDPDVNLAAGAAYLKALQVRYGDDLALVLAAYNAGEGAVDRHGRSVPPYPETRLYVQHVLSVYRALRAALGAAVPEAR
jgi:soluble lytic murein transglycosylase-like protein